MHVFKINVKIFFTSRCRNFNLYIKLQSEFENSKIKNSKLLISQTKAPIKSELQYKPQKTQNPHTFPNMNFFLDVGLKKPGDVCTVMKVITVAVLRLKN